MDYNFIENSTDFFKDTNEYFDLRRKFQGIFIWFDMIVAPLITIVSFLLYGTYDLFAILGFWKALTAFQSWLRYRYLMSRLKVWKALVNENGGPQISTNDPEYHIFVYADGMQRLQNKLFKGCNKNKSLK